MRKSIQFLGIGAARAGTTWLWRQLRKHDEIWMPPVKELHYFDRNPSYPSPSHLWSDSILKRLIGQERHNKRFRKRFVKEMFKEVVYMRPSNIPWKCKYLLNPCTIEWYKSLFDHGGGMVKGEITPGYSILNIKDIKKIHNTFPGLKIIYLIRNPIYRSWSHFKYEVGAKEGLYTMIENFDKEVHEMQNDYVDNYRRWVEVFGNDRVRVEFYDDIVNRPVRMVNSVGRFLGLSDMRDISGNEGTMRRVNASRQVEMPEGARSYLASKYIDKIHEMEEVFGSYAQHWKEEANEVLSLK